MNWFKKLRALRWYILGRKKIRKAIANAAQNGKVNVVLGASYVEYENWICTDLPHFNVLKENDWRYLFQDNRADHLLSEHVFEHLTPEQVALAVRHCYQYLKISGRLRIAVPDEWHPDPVYFEHIRIGGSGAGAEDHHSMWNIESLTELMESTGFKVTPLEHWTRDKNIVTVSFRQEDGPIRRTIQFNTQGLNLHNYSSLIIDAIKV